MPCRTTDLVLRVRISSCGVVDVLMHDAGHTDIAFQQQEDLMMFGALILMLCCSNVNAMSNLQKALDHLTRNFSADLKSVVLFLISKASPHKVPCMLTSVQGRYR